MEHIDFVNYMKQEFLTYAEKEGITDSESLSSLARRVFDEIAASLSNENEMTVLSSDNAVVEFVDKHDHKLYRRYLELMCYENSYGLRLIGEGLSGGESQIVFLSGSALEKISELQGEGPDRPRCE